MLPYHLITFWSPQIDAGVGGSGLGNKVIDLMKEKYVYQFHCRGHGCWQSIQRDVMVESKVWLFTLFPYSVLQEISCGFFSFSFLKK